MSSALEKAKFWPKWLAAKTDYWRRLSLARFAVFRLRFSRWLERGGGAKAKPVRQSARSRTTAARLNVSRLAVPAKAMLVLAAGIVGYLMGRSAMPQQPVELVSAPQASQPVAKLDSDSVSDPLVASQPTSASESKSDADQGPDPTLALKAELRPDPASAPRSELDSLVQAQLHALNADNVVLFSRMSKVEEALDSITMELQQLNAQTSAIESPALNGAVVASEDISEVVDVLDKPQSLGAAVEESDAAAVLCEDDDCSSDVLEDERVVYNFTNVTDGSLITARKRQRSEDERVQDSPREVIVFLKESASAQTSFDNYSNGLNPSSFGATLGAQWEDPYYDGDDEEYLPVATEPYLPQATDDPYTEPTETDIGWYSNLDSN